jgi:peptide/nickel transport system permease protein
MTTAALARAEAPTVVRSSGRRRRWSWRSLVLLGVLAAVVLAALLAPLIAPYGPTEGDPSDRLLGLGAPGHLLGTDGQGRDVLSRLLLGMRLSLTTGLIPTVIAGVIGTAFGMAAGLGRRWANLAIMRTLDVFYAFPSILLAIAIAAALGPNIRNAIIALSVVLVPPVARIVEAEVMALRGGDFMRAAECSGASRLMIAHRHVLPNIAVPVLVYCTALVGLAMVEAAGLSFLGLGAAPPTAEWGLMLNEGRSFFFTNPAVALAPAVAILLAALMFNALGDRLRVELNVRSQEATP